MHVFAECLPDRHAKKMESERTGRAVVQQTECELWVIAMWSQDADGRMVQHNPKGWVRMDVLGKGRSQVNTNNCTEFVKRNVLPHTMIVTDGAPVYHTPTFTEMHCLHSRSDHSHHHWVDPQYRTRNGKSVGPNRIECEFSCFSRMLKAWKVPSR